MKFQKIVLLCPLFMVPFSQAQPPQENDLTVLDINPAFEEMDTNNDGQVSKDEWFTAGMSQMSYDGLFQMMLDKDKSGALSREEMTSAQPMFEVDTNGDGKASMKEFVDANNAAGERRQNEMGDGAGSPPGMPPGSPPGQ